MVNTDFTARCMAGKALDDVAGKQDVIADLDTIRAGAEAGATAVQPATLENYQPKIDSTHKLDADLVDDTNSTNKFATQSELDQIELNKNNILSVADQSTQYNLINLHDPIAVLHVVPTYLPEGCVTLDVNNAKWTAFNISYPAIVGIKYKFVVRITATTGLSNFQVFIRDTDSEGTNVAEYPYGINNVTINSVGTHVFEFTATATTMWIGFYPNNSGTAVTGSVTMKAQVIKKSLYDAGFTDYQPYAMSNAEITAWILAHS